MKKDIIISIIVGMFIGFFFIAFFASSIQYFNIKKTEMMYQHSTERCEEQIMEYATDLAVCNYTKERMEENVK